MPPAVSLAVVEDNKNTKVQLQAWKFNSGCGNQPICLTSSCERVQAMAKCGLRTSQCVNLSCAHQEKQAPFYAGGHRDKRRVFELKAHPDAVEFICKNHPLGMREAVIEQACLFVEGRSNLLLCRYQRTLQVCSMLITMQQECLRTKTALWEYRTNNVLRLTSFAGLGGFGKCTRGYACCSGSQDESSGAGCTGHKSRRMPFNCCTAPNDHA